MLAFAVGLLAILWTGLAVHLSLERDDVLERREAENENLAGLLEEHVRRTLAAAGMTLKQIEAEFRRQGTAFDIARYLKDHRDELAPYTVLSVVNRSGDLVLSSIPFRTPQNFRHLENAQFHAANPTQEIFIARPRPGTLSGRSTVYLTRRMDNPVGSFGGYIGVGLDPQYFSQIFDAMKLGANAVVTLVGRDGFIRARRSDAGPHTAGPGDDMRSSSLFRTHLSRANSGTFRAVSPIDGVRRLYSYRSIEPYPLVLLLGSTEASALANFEQRTARYLWVFAIVSGVIVFFAGLFTRQMSREGRLVRDLRESHDRYAMVERATNDGIWDRNLGAGVDYLSPRARELLGCAEGEPPADAALLERVHPEDAERVREVIARSTRLGTAYQVEYRVLREDYGYRWLLLRGEVVPDANGNADRIVGAFTDITERKASERYIQEQARLLDQIFRHSIDCIVVLDSDYNFVRVSDSYAKVCRRHPSEFEGRNHFDLYPSGLANELEPYRLNKETYSASARPFVFPDHPEWGETYWDLSMVPIVGEDTGRIEQFLFTLKDVTAWVRSEENTRELILRIRALASRSIAVQEEERRSLARELHDEIGQELTAAKIRLQAMGIPNAGAGDRDWRCNLEEVLIAVDRALEQVRNLSLDLRPMMLDDLGLASAVRALALRDAAAAGWTVHVHADLPTRRFDSAMELACYRVAQESLTNAMRHSGATEVWVSLQVEEEQLRLAVRDNGCGFDQESARTTSARRLGLLGMEERMRDLAGTFEIVTAPGRGTEIRAALPVGATAACSEAMA